MENIVRVDFHAHSVHGSNDAKATFEQIAGESKKRGIDVIVITEHDNITEEDTLLEMNVKYGVVFIPGIEISLGHWGHFIAIGINSFIKKLKHQLVRTTDVQLALKKLDSKLISDGVDFYTHQDFRNLMTNNLAYLVHDSNFMDDPLIYCQKIHDEGGFISWAHPFVGNKLRKHFDNYLMQVNAINMDSFLSYLRDNDSTALELFENLDAIEGYNGLEFGLTSFLAADLAKALGKPMTAGSDGHVDGQYGTSFMEIHTDKKSIKDTWSLIWAMKNCEITFGTNT